MKRTDKLLYLLVLGTASAQLGAATHSALIATSVCAICFTLLFAISGAYK